MKRNRKIHAAVTDLEDETLMDAGGAVLSIQSATVDLPESELEMLWSASSLERLARSYWSYL
ncbi:MAG: hypothetical protein NT122_03075, partial [Solirubrobacterales bacterium]|nr:hypothetical protein [Solirubrobacterales bacterium]